MERALILAAQWHDKTYRKSDWCNFGLSHATTPPVIVHLASVALLLQRAGWDEATIAAGLLHDIIEDGNCNQEHFSYEQLAAIMGTNVADLVADVTEQKVDAQGDMRSWKERKVDYLAHLRNSNSRAVAISLADKINNVWTMNQTLKSGINIFVDSAHSTALSAGPKEQVWYFSSVISIARKYDDPRLQPLANALQEQLDDFKSLCVLCPEGHSIYQ